MSSIKHEITIYYSFFLKFLVRNKIKENYLRAFKKQHKNLSLYSYIFQTIKRNRFLDLIDFSIDWSETDEGFDFWYDINDYFEDNGRDFLQKYKKNT